MAHIPVIFHMADCRGRGRGRPRSAMGAPWCTLTLNSEPWVPPLQLTTSCRGAARRKSVGRNCVPPGVGRTRLEESQGMGRPARIALGGGAALFFSWSFLRLFLSFLFLFFSFSFSFLFLFFSFSSAFEEKKSIRKV
jgi:hypothetical protein